MRNELRLDPALVQSMGDFLPRSHGEIVLYRGLGGGPNDPQGQNEDRVAGAPATYAGGGGVVPPRIDPDSGGGGDNDGWERHDCPACLRGCHPVILLSAATGVGILTAAIFS